MVRPTKFEMQQRNAGSTLILSIAGELDMSTVELLAQRIDENLRRQATDLTLDLRELAFMDSTGLRLLIELHDRSRQEAWRLRIISPEHETAAVILRITGADTALPFEPEIDS
jgi:anti-sigma B factor antagonist